MGNLGQREKYGLGLVVILIVAFIIYFAGIRNLQNQKVDLEIQRAELQSQIDTLQALKDNNAETQNNIKLVTEEIKELEKTFIPVINTEAVEQYVIKTFEDNGAIYLDSITSETVVAPTIVLPNGSAAKDKLQVLRVTVNYATTDGFNFGQYNQTPDYASYPIEEMEELIESQYASDEPMYAYDENAPLQDYLAFIRAVKAIEATGIPADSPEGTPSTCVKVNSIQMKSEGGYMILTATIDFYSAVFSDRLSEPDMSAPYVTWNGTPVAQIGNDGEMGRRFIFLESDSDWNYIMMVDGEALAGERPFAAYWSKAIFTDTVNTNGLPATLLGAEAAGEAPETPVDEVVVEEN